MLNPSSSSPRPRDSDRPAVPARSGACFLRSLIERGSTNPRGVSTIRSLASAGTCQVGRIVPSSDRPSGRVKPWGFSRCTRAAAQFSADAVGSSLRPLRCPVPNRVLMLKSARAPTARRAHAALARLRRVKLAMKSSPFENKKTTPLMRTGRGISYAFFKWTRLFGTLRKRSPGMPHTANYAW